MKKLSLKEKLYYGFILNENRVYKYWYTRFLITGVTLDRIRRVVSRIKKFYSWCDEWSYEGEKLEKLAEEYLKKGKINTAKTLFHEAAGCFHIGQYVFFLDINKKYKAQERVRANYEKAIQLYDAAEKPIRIEIPFRSALIPGYLRLSNKKNRPLVIFVDGSDNLKEVENHYWSSYFLKEGYNFFTFDGPGQGEMWQSVKMIPDYEIVVSTIIDWFNKNNSYEIDLTRIGIVGFSLGGYLAPRAAGFDKRITCAIGFGGIGYLNKRLLSNPYVKDMIFYITGFKNTQEVIDKSKINIQDAPSLDRPLLFIQGGKDKLISESKKHADYILNWATGEKELQYYPDGDHCCANYLDELFPYALDWLNKHIDFVH